MSKIKTESVKEPAPYAWSTRAGCLWRLGRWCHPPRARGASEGYSDCSSAVRANPPRTRGVSALMLALTVLEQPRLPRARGINVHCVRQGDAKAPPPARARYQLLRFW